MALHLKSTKSFKILIGFSALLISGMAATFSVTGIATLFSGYFITVAFMMGVLEFGKIVVASFLARYWNAVSKVLRGYFMIAIMVLILITSAGIFGYLSDAYQKTKGDYTIVEKQVSILDAKKTFFLERKERLQADRQLELNAKKSNQTRMDSLTSRNQNTTRTREDIKENNTKILALEKQISAIEDSASSYDLQMATLESQNIKGELGPLKYIAGIFNTDMDTVVKYLIFLLIFVFDPLAVLLFVSLNLILRKEHGMFMEDELQDVPKKDESEKNSKIQKIATKLKDGIKDKLSVKKNDNIIAEEVLSDNTGVDELIENLQNETQSADSTININENEREKQEHEFYYGENINNPEDKPHEYHLDKKSSNYHPT